jgi:hypothetical protein
MDFIAVTTSFSSPFQFRPNDSDTSRNTCQLWAPGRRSWSSTLPRAGHRRLRPLRMLRLIRKKSASFEPENRGLRRTPIWRSRKRGPANEARDVSTEDDWSRHSQ